MWTPVWEEILTRGFSCLTRVSLSPSSTTCHGSHESHSHNTHMWQCDITDQHAYFVILCITKNNCIVLTPTFSLRLFWRTLASTGCRELKVLGSWLNFHRRFLVTLCLPYRDAHLLIAITFKSPQNNLRLMLKHFEISEIYEFVQNNEK